MRKYERLVSGSCFSSKTKNICITTSTYRKIDLWRIPYEKQTTKMKNIPYWLRSKEISDLIDTKCMLNWQRYN